MKKKVGIFIEEDIIRRAKRRAAEEGRLLGDLIRDALVWYLSRKAPDPQKRKRAYQIFCEQPIRISKKHFDEILSERDWDQ